MRVLIALLFLSAFVYLSSADHPGVGESGGQYDGVPDAWTCTSIWFNELQRIDNDEYAQFQGRNLTALFGAPIGTSIPTEDNWACDCGCGVWDPDCDAPVVNLGDPSPRDLTWISCEANRADTSEVEPRTTTCQPSSATCFDQVPETWFCEPKYYAEGASGYSAFGNGEIVCDCGCGAYDPDCALGPDDTVFPLGFSCSRDDPVTAQPSNTVCGIIEDGDISTTNPAKCMSVPPTWTCNPHLYDQAARGFDSPTCDCSCGAWDPDCDLQSDDAKGLPLHCGDGLNTGNNAFCDPGTLSCVLIPDGWTCPTVRYAERWHSATDNSPVCDCACGIYDPDCDLNPGGSFLSGGSERILDTDVSIRCSRSEAASRDHKQLCNAELLACEAVPASWTCTPRWFNEAATGATGANGSPDCDCGCGIWDPDCDVAGAPLFCSRQAGEDTHGQYCNVVSVPIETATTDEHESWGICTGAAFSLSASLFSIFSLFLLSLFF